MDGRLDTVEIALDNGTFVFGAAVQIVQVAVVSAEVLDAGDLRFRAGFQLAAASTVSECDDHLVGVLSISSESLHGNEVRTSVVHCVRAFVVRVYPATLSLNSCSHLCFDGVAAGRACGINRGLGVEEVRRRPRACHRIWCGLRNKPSFEEEGKLSRL